MRNQSVLPLLLVCFCSLFALRAQTAPPSGRTLMTPPPFRPGELWPDDAGVPINAHGAGFLYHDGKYFWFGEFKTEGEAGNRANVGISVYSSRDLYRWHNEGIALKVSDDPASDIVRGCILERPKVLYNPKTRLYVMWVHIELKGQGYKAALAGVATSSSPTGPYTYLRSFRPDGEMSRDMTLFQEDDGKAYLITTSEDNQTQHVSQLTDDYLDTTGHYTRMLAHQALEGEAIFKSDGHYFYVGSHTTGWAPNPAVSAVAESITGPWRLLGNPARGEGAELTFGSQSAYVLPVAGKKRAFILIADRWQPKNAIDGRYVWLPIVLDGESFTVPWRASWDLSVFHPAP